MWLRRCARGFAHRTFTRTPSAQSPATRIRRIQVGQREMREMNPDDCMVGSSGNGIAALQRVCDDHLRRGQVLQLSMLFLAPAVLVLAVVASLSAVVEPFLVVVPAVSVYFLLMALDSANDSTCQRAREEQTTLIVSVIRDGGHVDFAAYLRGDVTDDRLDDESYDAQYGRHLQKTEKGLANALQPIAPLIAIGGKPGTIGAGRCSVQQSEWRGVVSQLMERARLLFFLPWFSPGVAWEAGK